MPTKSSRPQRDSGDRKPAQRVSTARRATRGEPRRHTATVTLPFVTAEFRAPNMSLPALRVPSPPIGRSELAAAAQTVRSFLPPPRTAAYYGGMAALAVFDVIDWPVAAAIGIGTALFRRRDSHSPQTTRHAERPSSPE